MAPTLRPYQAAMLDAARRLPLGPSRRSRVLFQLPTGGGKTALALALALSHLGRDTAHRVLWFAHRDELVEQPLGKLRGWSAPVAALRPGEPPPGDARIIVASIQTVLARGLDVLPRASLVVLDEARHYADAPEWSAIARAVAEGRHVIGLDATPSGDLRPLFDHLVPGPSVAELTEQGHLVPAVHIGPAEEQTALADDPIDAYLRHVSPGRALIFCRDVAHAYAVAADAQRAGVRAACVEGRVTVERRREALAAYLRGELDVLTNVMCLVEGTDLPSTEGVIVARGVSNEETWIQIGGRGLRPFPGKTRCKLVDLLGLTHRFGLLSEPRTWGLDGKGLAPRPANLPPVVTCPRCLALAPPSAVCPGCGMATPPRPPPRLSKAALHVIEQDRRARAGRGWERWCEIVWEGRRRGWKPQAAPLTYQREFGAFPRWRADHVPPEPGAAPANDGTSSGQRRTA